MKLDFYQYTNYPKISKEYTIDDIRKFIDTITFTKDDKVYTTDEVYLHYFGNANTPEELKRPLSQLSKDEMSLLQMIHI